MKAKFVNEKFIEKSDPLEDMGIGLIGLMLHIPYGWQRSVTNKVYKRFSGNTLSYHDDWKIVKAEMQGDYIEVDLESKNTKTSTTHAGLLLTPQQIDLFAKKYQKLHNESGKST